MPHLPAIVLAAGLSTRMGAFKPLLPLAGKPLIHHVLSALHDSGAVSPMLLVTGHRHHELEAALPPVPHLRTHFNPHYANGEMLTSLLIGMAALPPAAPAFLLAFADQPAVRPATVAQLVHTFFRSHLHDSAAPQNPMQSPFPPLVLPTHLGKRGHPVVISTSLVPEIRSLSPGESLKTVVHRHLEHAATLNVDDPSIHDDLDTPADFARAQATFSPSHPPAPYPAR